MEGGVIKINIMDKDDYSSDELKGAATVAMPAPGEALNGRIPFTEDLANSKAEPKLEIGIYLLPLDDLLRAPNLINALKAKVHLRGTSHGLNRSFPAVN